MDRTSTSPARGRDDARPADSIWSRAWRRPLGHHVIGLLLVVLALTPLLGGTGLFTSDEGAAMAQAQLLADGRGWGLDVPRPDLDPGRDLRPIDISDAVTGAPLAKHPTYPVLLVPFVAVAGTLGAKLVSLFGMVLAAAAAALIARHLRPDLGRPVLWATGLASPLFFDAWIVVAHTLGAACCGFATLAAIQALERRRARMLLAVVVLSAVAVLMRNEAVLFAGAMAFGGLAVSARRRSLPGLLVAGAAVIGAGIGYAVDTALTGLVASPDGPFVVGETLQSTSFLESRVEPTIRTLILPGHQLTGITGLLLLVALGAAVAAAVTVRERPGEHRRIIVLCGVAVGAVGLRLLGDPAAVPGLFAAFPLLAAGLLLLTADHLRRPPVTFMAVTSGVFVAAVLATQYEDGGGAQWGFRYAAVALPLLVPLAFLGLAEARDRLDPTTSVIATRLVAVLCVGAFGLALRTLHAHHGATVHAIGAITDVVEDSDRPVVVTYDPAVGRLAWSSILDGQDWVLAEPGEMTSFAERLTRDGGDVVFVTYDADRELDAFARTHEVVERLPASPSGDLEVVRLVRR